VFLQRRVKARLRRDVFLIPTDGGVRILTNRGGTTLTGSTIYEWASALARHLDGSVPVATLVRPLPPDKRAMVEDIVAALFERGLVRDGAVSPAGDAGRTGGTCPELGYLDSFLPAAGKSYEDYRQARIAVTAPDPFAAELVEVLRRSGADARLDAELDPSPDLLVRVLDHPDPGHPAALARDCARSGVELVLAVRYGDELWTHAGANAAAWWRWARWRTEHQPAGTTLSPESVSLAASMLAMSAFRLLTGVAEPAGESTMTRLELSSLRTASHRFLPRPPADRRSITSTLARLSAAGPLDPDTLDAAGSRLRDRYLGVIGELSERDFVQLPVNVAVATVAGRRHPVTGAGLSVAQARWRAVLAGVTAHAVSIVDPDKLVDGQVLAARLADGAVRAVDPSAVFAAPDRRVVGAATGYRWSEAVSAGLLDWCAHLTATRPGPAVRLDPDALDPDEEARAYLAILRILEVPVAVYDVTGPLRVPTLAFHAGERTIAYVSAWRAGDALADGLRAVALDEQSRRHGQPDYAPEPVPQLDTAAAPAGIAAAPSTERDAVAALTASGLEPVVVPLDHDRGLHEVMPFVARVVLLDV
jgi:hypothetical protein